MNSLPYNKFIEMIDSPVSNSIAEMFLSDSKLRDDFLMEYLYFKQDANKKIYKK